MSESEEKNELYLVTGAAGFAGGHLLRYLIGQGIRVRAMVRSEAQRAQVEADGATEVVLGDLAQPETLPAAVQGVHGIYHIAALFRQQKGEEEFVAINQEGVRHLIDAAVEAGVPRLIHCSTGGVLGHIKNPPGTETSPYNPGDIYQVTKLEGEKIALEAFRSGKLSGVVIRPAMIYGPGDARTLKIFRMIARKRFFYVGDGSTHVHWIDARDLARSFHLAMMHTERNAEIYQICGRRPAPLREFCEIVAKALGVPPPWLKVPVKPMQNLGTLCEWVCKPFGIEPPLYRRRVDFYTKRRWFSCEKAEKELGFSAAQSLEDEVADIVQDYRENGKL